MDKSTQRTPDARWPRTTFVSRLLFHIGPLRGLTNLLTSERIVVVGASMEPTFLSGEHVLVSRLAYRLALPRRGDVVLLRDPWVLKGDYIKRIVGLPGDEVTLDEGKVAVGGIPLAEPYRGAGLGSVTYGEWELGPDEFLVMGDNREASQDGRFLGSVARSRIVGKAWFRYWPRSRWGRVG